MSDPARARRLADQIKQIVAQALDRKVKDPRLGFVTVTDVRVTNDLQNATVFYTVFGDEETRESTAQALRSARGMLRTEVGRNVNVRLTPTLEFIPDALPETSSHIEGVLRQAAEKDAQVQSLSQGANYAGDANPYGKPEDGFGDDDFADEDPDDGNGDPREAEKP